MPVLVGQVPNAVVGKVEPPEAAPPHLGKVVQHHARVEALHLSRQAAAAGGIVSPGQSTNVSIIPISFTSHSLIHLYFIFFNNEEMDRGVGGGGLCDNFFG